MRISQLSLVTLVALLSSGFGHPADKATDNRAGIDRPSTETPPQVSECGLDSLLGQVFGSTGNSNCGGGGKQPTDNSGGNPAPLPSDNNQGGYQPSPPDNNQGGYEPSPPDNNVGGYDNNNNNNNQYEPDQPSPEGCSCVPYYLCNDNNTINEDGVGLIDIRIKEEGCADAIERCCGGAYIREPDNPVTPKPNINSDSSVNAKCGKRNFEGVGFRITGNNDNEAQYGEFPWMVAVIRPDETLSSQGKAVNVYQCGGSLIHPQVVLTGAHCVKGKNNLVIRAGEWDTQTKNELYPTQDRKVVEVIIHEHFNEGSLANDPALLILDNPVDLSVENVGLICLPGYNENMDGRNCVASGWGKDLFGKEGKYQVILKRVELPMVPRQQCLAALRKTRLGQRFKLHESFVCAGGIPGKDTCKGDGGGPLVCPTRDNPRIYVQAGLVAWGIDCGTETPGVYASVPYFVNWIYDKLQAKGISLDSY